MSARPGRIESIIDVTLPRERTVDTRETEDYFRLVTAVREALRGRRDGAADHDPGVDMDADDGEGGLLAADARRVAAEGLGG
jgi:hypothetical protein